MERGSCLSKGGPEKWNRRKPSEGKQNLLAVWAEPGFDRVNTSGGISSSMGVRGHVNDASDDDWGA